MSFHHRVSRKELSDPGGAWDRAASPSLSCYFGCLLDAWQGRGSGLVVLGKLLALPPEHARNFPITNRLMLRLHIAVTRQEFHECRWVINGDEFDLGQKCHAPSWKVTSCSHTWPLKARWAVAPGHWDVSCSFTKPENGSNVVNLCRLHGVRAVTIPDCLVKSALIIF